MATEESNYGGSEIKVLKGLEAVRMRPGMYIGTTSETGLHHLVWEIVDNSVDEAMAGYCNKILVTVHPDNSITVVDNGRGIPVDMHPTEKKPTLEVVLTILHAGGKFDNNAYKVSGGLHGVGVSVVNALSKKLIAQVKRDGKIYEMQFSRGKTIEKMKEVGKSKTTGTTITFWPDEKIFETTVYNFDTLKNHLQETAFLNKNLKIVLTDERELVPRVEEFCYAGGINDFVKFLNGWNPEKKTYEKTVLSGLSKPIYIEGKTDEDTPLAKKGEVEVSMQWNTGYSEHVMSFANDIYTEEGGMHLEGFRTALTKTVNDYARSHKLLKEKEANLTGDDIREGLTAVISVKLPDPQFEGQTKAKLGSSYMRTLTNKIVARGLADYLEEHPKQAKEIFKKASSAAKGRLAAQKARQATRRKSILESASLPGKLADCSVRDAAMTELFIVEGDSAGGSAKDGRRRDIARGRPQGVQLRHDPEPDHGHRYRRHDGRGRLRHQQGPLPQDHHHDRCRRRRRSHPHSADDVLLQVHASADRCRLHLQRLPADLWREGGQENPLRVPRRQDGGGGSSRPGDRAVRAARRRGQAAQVHRPALQGPWRDGPAAAGGHDHGPEDAHPAEDRHRGRGSGRAGGFATDGNLRRVPQGLHREAREGRPLPGRVAARAWFSRQTKGTISGR